MENGIKKVMFTLMEENFSQEERRELNKLFDKIPEDNELMQVITHINSLYFKKGFISGIELKKYLEI